MKHRGISWLLALTFLLSVFMFCTTAFAATATQDGLTAELITDKTAYASGEEVDAKLKITNNGNAKVNNIRTELILPEGLSLKRGTLVSPSFDLDAGTDKDVDYLLDIEATTPSTTTVPVTTAPATTAPVTTAPATTVPATTVAGTTAVGTTVAGTTVAPTGTPGGPSDTGDFSLYIFGALAVFSLIGLVVVMGGFKGLLKNRWFVLVLCAALLMPVLAPVVSIAAPADKSFTVDAEITVDGAPAVVTAKVTYDVDGDYVIEGNDELKYKEAGTILYKLSEAEKGYFLPSDITYQGVGTSKDGSNRPEVYAPYTEMLFGSYLGSTAKPGLLDGTKLFKEDATNGVLVGMTKDAASAKALELIEKNQWIIAEIDGKLVVTGWYDDATVAAVKYLYDVVNADENVTLNLPIIGGLEYAHGNMPILENVTFLNGMDSDQGAVVLRYEGEKAAFQAYADKLEAGGWTLYHENTLYGYKNAENLFATYVQGDDVIHIAYLYNSLPNATEQEVAGFDSAMTKAWEASYRSVDNEIRVILESTNELFPIDDPAELDLSHVGGVAQPEQLHVINLFTPYADGNDVGACMVYTLADGSFFVWDGGIASDANILYKTLKAFNKRDDGIVIAAWVLTHDHNDHTGAFQAMANSEWASELTVEKVIVNRSAPSYSWRGSNDPYGYAYGFSGVIGNVEALAAKFKGDAQMIVPHMGQTIELRNLNIEVLASGEEDVFPVIINNDNAWSLVTKITYDGIDQSVMMLADSALDQTYNIFFPLMLNELDADIIQTAHHGLGGNTSRLYPIFNKNIEDRLGEDAQHVVIWNTSERSLIDNNGTVESANTTGDKYMRFYTGMNKALRPQYGGHTVEDIIADTHVKTLTFPYEVGTYTKTYITGNKSNFFDSENIKVGYVPAFRFQNTFDTKAAEILEQLASYDADVLVVSQLAQLCSLYENIDIIDGLTSNLGYTFSYYAPAWKVQDGADLSTGAGTAGHMILSRIPIAEAETIYLTDPVGGTIYKPANQGGYTEGRSAAHVVLDLDGLKLDIYAGHFDTASWGALGAAIASAEYAPVGEYWMLVGNNNKFANSASVLDTALGITGTVDAGLNDGDYEIYLSSGAVASDPVVDNTWKTTCGNNNMGNGYTVNVKLSRKVLVDDLEIGQFDDIPTVGQWWVNYLNQTTNKEQVARWLLKNKHEVVGLVHVPSELQNDATAAEFAELVGYPYYYVVKIPNANGNGGSYGHMLLSAYPLEIKDDIIIRSEANASKSPNKPAESYGHVVVDMTSTALNTKVNFIFGDMDANNNNGLERDAQRTALEAAIKDITDASGLPFVLLSGYDNGHIKNLQTYAGKTFSHNTHPWSNCIVASAPLPMSGREFFGTTAFPENGESPIKITIPNVDPYVKADLAAIPEFQVTVDGGVGNGTFQIGKTVTVTANKPAYGKAFDKWVVVEGGVTLADDTASKTTFVMGNAPVVVKATYKDVPVQVKTPIGQNKTIKVAVQPVFRYSAKWNQEGAKDLILNHYRSVAADVLALTLIDKNVASYNGADVVGIITQELSDLYQYSFYAPGNAVDGGDLATGESTYGHLILSKYPIEFSENIMLTDNGGAAEDRTVNHSVIKLDDNTKVDLYATHIGTASSEWPVLAANFNQKGDYFLILGNTKIAGSGSTADSYLGTTGTTSGCTNHITMLGSAGLTFNGQCAADSTVSSVLPPNMDPLHATTVTVPLLSEAVTKYAVNVDGVSQGYYAADEEVTLTAPNPGVGKRFKNWVLPQGLVPTDGTTVNDRTIKFTMPAAILDLTTEKSDVSSFFVTVNGTQVGEYEPNDTVKVTAPASGSGKVFAGWTGLGDTELKQGYSDKYITIEFTMPQKDVDLVATYADLNASAAYPTYTALGTNVQSLKVDYLWGADGSSAATMLSGSAADVVIFSNCTASEADLIAAAGTKYPYVVRVSSDSATYPASVGKCNALVSKYPFVHKDSLAFDGVNEGRSFGYVTLDVNGVFIDAFFGENNGGNGNAVNTAIFEPWVKAHVAASGNPFIVSGYSFYHSSDTSFASMNKNSTINTGSGSILYSNGINFVSGSKDTAKIGKDTPIRAELSINKKVAYSGAAWRVEYSDTAPTSVHRGSILNWFHNIAKSDYVSVAGVDMTKAVAKENLMAEALAYGYTYYSFVADTATSTRGTLLLSKYPLVEVETFMSGTVQFKKVQMKAYGKTVDIYFGAEPNWAANAYDTATLFAKLDASVQAGNPAVVLGNFIWQSAGGYTGQKVTSNAGNDMCVIGVGLKRGANIEVPAEYASPWPAEVMRATFAAPAPTNYAYANLELA